ncbi:SGNH/GDSL hydrolase family protein [bacterium]|nr:SGNH/GDSL hydrolase family protein [bacterium]
MARRTSKRRAFAFVAVILGLAAVAVAYEVLVQYTQKGLLADATRRYVEAARDAEYLIAVVGDSHAKGMEAPPGFDYPTQLELRLQLLRPKSKIRVANIADAGFNTSQAVDRLHRVVQRAGRDPDLVIFNAGFNNIWNFQKAWFIPEDIQGRKLEAQLRFLLTQSANYRLGVITVKRMRQLIDRDQTYRGHHTAVLNADDPNELAFLSSWIKRDIESLADNLAARKTRLVVVSYWNDCRWLDEVLPELGRGENVFVADVHGLGFDHMSTADFERSLVAPGSHPNKYGYARIAELLAGFLDDAGLLPAKKPAAQHAATAVR